ncbi:Sua5/YciO/YrdC/YwlC family protein [Spongiibacter sp. KMU-158]|uniref:Threonylcarbamoyl-AMP synthase n=1 Tax=Spongiibacter pelagi TaxID=2760804 RepID=A0A927GV73_9GAMM|nr:Sua5/YciO/YrdC/YwlC family protein [Spongiibacter pelagi]MBD2857582.1 Sua5/YciO/YrdC/YwlC family protein [Spongiibacter pelagi]
MSALFSHYRLHTAATVLKNGGVVSHPTEAVWGLACLPDNRKAVEKIWELKSRDPAKGVLLICDDVRRLAPLLDGLPEDVRNTLAASWPGPNTWVIPDQQWAPVWVRGIHQSVAVRVTDHPLAAALCKAANSCLVSTSANPAGREPARTQHEAQAYFAKGVDYYLSGACGDLGQPTTIRDALSGKILRGS